ncbi:type 2 lanthipeptide synthetase LanM family protein [Paenibacillus fonticola]|uniref:type 2 lanthipeptide synthetase LanM family protein n=1 Tax=Paenibacillus fonticola TaxID=379896 RepID=UPI0003817EB3|nr:type 2 lanthipeptide synthetase LanM family protein [Paenibacillus fonticola]
MLCEQLFSFDNWLKGSYLSERAYVEGVLKREDIVDQWLKVGDFSEEKLQYRLEADELDLDSFENIISNRDSIRLKDKKSLEWVNTLKEIFHADTNFVSDCKDKPLFYNFYVPFLEYAKTIFKQKYDLLGRTYHTRYVVNFTSLELTALNQLFDQLSKLSFRTLIQELHIAKISDELIGDTSEERYLFYVENILANKNYLISLLQLYPVLARLIIEIITRFTESYFELLERFINDVDLISKVFQGNYNHLIKIDVSAGDHHHGGRSVSILVFESGDKIVYKPRSLDLDYQFSYLTSWLNGKGFKYSLKTVKTISKEGYGWQEFVSNKACSTEKQVERYYYRFGGYVALLYILNAVDFHLENVIAHEEFPILIDMETLFCNHYDLVTGSIKEHVVNKEFSDSIFASLLLPVKSITNQEEFDFSAIVNIEKQESNNEVWVIENKFTDEMRMTKKKAQFTSSTNRLFVGDKVINPLEYYHQIIDGFQDMYNILLRHKSDLLLQQLASFSDKSVRHILRPTKEYGFLLETSLHPDYLQDGLSRVKLFDHLWRESILYNRIQGIIHYETFDLLNNDIPHFCFEINNKYIFSGKNNVIENFYQVSCLDNLYQKIDKLSPIDCEKQIRYIRLSLESQYLPETKVNYQGNENAHLSMKLEAQNNSELFLEKAKQIGDFLIEHAIWDKESNQVFWLEIKKENGMILPTNESLYDGLLGISLFLAYLARETNEEKYVHLAKAALSSVQSHISEQNLENISAYNGIAGVAYGYYHLGAIWGNKKLHDSALKVIFEAEQFIEKDTELDLIGGVTGLMYICIQLYQKFKNEHLINLSNKCAQHLINSNQEKIKSQRLLTGFSHGAAGMAWVMTELWSITDNTLYYDYLNTLLQYEKRFYSAKESNWKDLRFSEKGSYSSFWCHGAPGIGLSRVLISKYYIDSSIRNDINVSIEKIKQSGFGKSLCLCHGNFGNVEILVQMAQLLNLQDLGIQATQMALKLVHNFDVNYWKNDLSNNMESLGLMNGISGIGYSLLRFHNPNIPSILSLQFPD